MASYPSRILSGLDHLPPIRLADRVPHGPSCPHTIPPHVWPPHIVHPHRPWLCSPDVRDPLALFEALPPSPSPLLLCREIFVLTVWVSKFSSLLLCRHRGAVVIPHGVVCWQFRLGAVDAAVTGWCRLAL